MLESFVLETFQPHVGTVFQLTTGPDSTLDLELIEVKSLKLPGGEVRAGTRSEPFRLTFRAADTETYYEQQIFQLTHEELGPLEMFLVCIGPDDDGMCYEAIFN